MADGKRRIVLLIVGCHRSGTSAFARVLSLLGATLPKRIYMTSDRANDNTTGFWEPVAIVDKHDELLRSVGSRWDDPFDIPPAFFDSPIARRFQDELIKIIEEEYGDAPLVVIKDPRLPRLMPLWRRLLRETGDDIRVVLPVRNPLETALSLRARDDFSVGKGLLLWLRHNLSAERYSRDCPRSIVGYDNLLSDWRSVAQSLAYSLQLDWPSLNHSTAHEIDRFLQRKLRHQNTSWNELDARAEIVSWVKQLSSWLRAACAGESPDPAHLDVLQRNVEDADLAFGPIVAELQASLQSNERALTDQIAELRASAAAAAKASDLAAQERRVSQQVTAEAVSMQAMLTEDNANLKATLAECQRVTDDLGSQLDMTSRQLAESQASLAQRDRERDDALARLAEHERAIGQLDMELRALQETIGWQMLERLRRLRERLLPSNLPRGPRYRLLRKGLLTAIQQGPVVAGWLAGEKVARTLRNVATRKGLRNPPPPGSATDDRTLAITEQIYSDSRARYQPRIERQAPSAETKLIAFYLPQFHPIPENDAWWGPGFTEWTNVTRARPQFVGHYQPHLPADLGFYDLRIKAVQEQQIEIARHYGIHAFCFHYYWFAGKRLLFGPLKQFLDNSDLDFPFCVCWANENWTRRWDGQEQDLLLAQNHTPDSDRAFLRDIAHILKDPRYVRIDGRPVLVVYRANILPDVSNTVKRWRAEAQQVGVGDLFLVAAQTFGFYDPTRSGFDGAVQFPPHGVPAADVTADVQITNPSFSGSVYRYADLANAQFPSAPCQCPVFRTVMPGWDNTARRGAKGHVYLGNTPQLYQAWLESALSDSVDRLPASMRFVFINAWNEWAEGAHLEPDQHFGYAYLNATAGALSKVRARNRRPRRKHAAVSVVVPSYNHERYVARALESVALQDGPDIELVVVDDGSTDNTVGVVREFIRKHPELPTTMVEQSNTGAHAAINRGIDLATGDYVALLNSDDYYLPGRIAALLDALAQSPNLIAFTDVETVNDCDETIAGENDFVKRLRKKIDSISLFPNLGYALLDSNVAISTGNLFFRRELYTMVGGFRSLKYCHDWDFLLTALRFSEPSFINRRFYAYRIHGTNSFRDLQHVAHAETDEVLKRFFSYAQNQPIHRVGFPCQSRDDAVFSRFVDDHGYGRYLHVSPSS